MLTLLKDLTHKEFEAAEDVCEPIQYQISNWKNDGLMPPQALAAATGPADMLCAQAYLRYNRALRAYNALDFDDLILLPAVLFQHQPAICKFVFDVV